jgi:1,2-phenylacetyl-CoA epoxidase PaaB subunit
MSKLRQQVDAAPSMAAVDAPPAGDLRAFVVFTQLKKGGPYIYAGWLDAPDEQMALTLAREHYGRDQVTTGLWLASREFIGGLRENLTAQQEPVASPREYQIFTQQNAGDQHVSSARITARSAAEAIVFYNGLRDSRTKGEATTPQSLGSSILSPPHGIWAIPVDEITATEEGELIWRFTDQSYRLARGYSKSVREKWEKVRGAKKTDEYEKEDLKETF